MANSGSSMYVYLQKLSNAATKQTLDYNTKEANTARAWQKQMSDTAHQREVEDLKKAGLNPVLASNQGAQSYTTSAASGQAENAAGAIASAYGADQGAAATRYAARQSAAATRAAAAANVRAAQIAAAANMYASDKGFESSKYSSDSSYKSTKYHADQAVKIAGINRTSSLWGNLANLFTKYNSGFSNRDFKNKFQTKASDIRNNPGKYVIDASKPLTFNNARGSVKQLVQSACRYSGLSGTLSQQKMVYNALILHKRSALSSWNSLVNAKIQARSSKTGRASAFRVFTNFNKFY